VLLGYRLNSCGVFNCRCKNFYFSHLVQNDLGDHPASCPMVAGVYTLSFKWSKLEGN
jgi:hypothetical protein